MDEINIEEYTSDRQKENISVEINENEKLNINYFKNTQSNVNNVHNMHKIIYDEDRDEKITRLTYLLTLEEMKRNNLLYNNNKLRYENVLKEMIIKKHNKDKELVNIKLKLYYFGYTVWQGLLGYKPENVILIE